MSRITLRDHIQRLRERDSLHVVSRQVDPKHELAAVTKAVQQATNDAVIFEDVIGTRHPVVTNLYNDRDRLCSIIDAGADEFCGRWNELHDIAKSLPFPETKDCEKPADIEDCALSDLPLITYHGRDAGPYFTSPIFIARHPLTGTHNLSFHRSMYINDNELRVRLGASHDLAAYQAIVEEQDEALEAAILIGADPAIFLCAGASIPQDDSEIAVAAAINGAPIDCYPAKTIDLKIPLGSQFVIEGRILPNVRRNEGPFGEFLGYYVEEGRNHVFEVSAVYHTDDALFHSILCGSKEDIALLEALTAAKTYRHLNNVLPGIVDVACSPTVMNTTIKIRQQYEGHSRQVLLAAFGAHLDYNKVCAVVDDDVDIHSQDDILWAFATRGRADTRTLVIPDMPGFYRDPNKDHWGRLGIDATYPFDRRDEFVRKEIPGEESIRLEDYLSS